MFGRSGLLILVMSTEISVSPCGRMPVAGVPGPDSATCRPGAIDWAATAAEIGRRAALPVSSAARTTLRSVFRLRLFIVSPASELDLHAQRELTAQIVVQIGGGLRVCRG